MNKNLIRHTTADKLARQSEVRQLEVGQYPQIVLAYGKQLDTLDLADKWPTPRIGMDVPGGRLQVGSSLREALQKPLFPSRIEQNRSVRFFFTTSKNGVFFAIKIV